jgi:cytochrome c-type protein NapC
MSGLGVLTLIAAASAAGILLFYLWRAPLLSLKWRLALFLGVAVLPTFAAGTSTVDGLERTTQREFCGSCHVMEAHYNDAISLESTSLAARHTRNHLFGENSCYKCHANYGLYGYPLTKMEGMRHVYHYYLGEYGSMTLEEAVGKIHINKPYPNRNCLHCHTGQGTFWMDVPDHASVKEDALSGRISCSSAGCHGAAHPFAKEAQEAMKGSHDWSKIEEVTP